jgi:hypothetical protein
VISLLNSGLMKASCNDRKWVVVFNSRRARSFLVDFRHKALLELSQLKNLNQGNGPIDADDSLMKFINQISNVLQSAFLAEEFRDLLVVAPIKLLGLLRRQSKRQHDYCLRGYIDNDFSILSATIIFENIQNHLDGNDNYDLV